MESFHQCLALGPLAIYMLLLGVINLARRPFLVSGARDAAVLGLAVSGLVVVGPMALMFPEMTAAHLGPNGFKYVWVMLLVLYALGLVVVLLTLRPRLVVYNISVDELRPALADLVERLDPDGRWAGDSLVLPRLGVQLYLDSAGWMRNVALVSAGPKQDYAGWAKLETSLATMLKHLEVRRNPRGMTLFSFGAFVIGMLAWTIASDPQGIARALFDLLQPQ